MMQLGMFGTYFGGTFLNSEEFQGLGLEGRRIRLCKNDLSSRVSCELPLRFPK